MRQSTARMARIDAQGVAKLLSRLGTAHAKLRDTYRARAFNTAAYVVTGLREPLTTADQLKGIRGCGSGIRERVAEALATGTLAELSELEARASCGDAKLTSVLGIGPVTAAKLKARGITTVPQLRLLDDPSDLTHMQRVGLKYFDDLQKLIPRPEADAHVTKVRKCVHRLYKGVAVEPCGSYRRQLPFVRDLDFLIESRGNESIADVVQGLGGYVVEELSKGPTKFMGVVKLTPDDGSLARRVDVRLVASKAFPTALAYFTGSALFNIRLREHAKAMGYLLNEYGLFRMVAGSTSISEEQRVPIQSEEELFKALRFPWVLPRDRTA